MTRGNETVEERVWVDGPPEAVFEQFTRPAQFEELLPCLESIEDSGTLVDGSQRLLLTCSTAGIETRTEAILTHCSRPNTLRYELVGDADGEIVWGFEAVDGGTEIHCEVTYALSESVLEGLPAEFVHRYNKREVSSLVANLRTAAQTEQS